MFYEALLASEVDAVSAKTMYMAVFTFGPRWVLEGNARGDIELPALEVEEQELALKSLREWVEKNNPSIRQIESRVESRRVRETGTRFLANE
jgi:hypothetical protein